MPSKKTAVKKTALLRGVELVEAALAVRKKKNGPLKGLPEKTLEKMTLGDRPLSPSLRAWLAADASFFKLGEPTSLAELISTDFGEEMAGLYAEVIEVLPHPIIVFEGWGADSRRFLYLGETDSHGEYTVMTIDTDDTPFLCVNGPVDVWLAQHAGFLEAEAVYGKAPKAYEAAKKEHGELNFNGFVVWEFMQFA